MDCEVENSILEAEEDDRDSGMKLWLKDSQQVGRQREIRTSLKSSFSG